MNPEDMDNDSSDIEIELTAESDRPRGVRKIPAKGDNAVIVRSFEKTVSGNGNPQIVFVFSTEDGIEFKQWYSLLPTAMWKLSELMMALDSDVKAGAKTKLSKARHLGRRFIAVIEHEMSEKEGQTYVNAKIKKHKPHPNGSGGGADESVPF
jgi:hypothetical protein